MNWKVASYISLIALALVVTMALISVISLASAPFFARFVGRHIRQMHTVSGSIVSAVASIEPALSR